MTETWEQQKARLENMGERLGLPRSHRAAIRAVLADCAEEGKSD